MLRALAKALLLGALAGGAILLRVWLHGEDLTERTGTLVGMAALAGAFAGLLLSPFFARRTGWLMRWRAGAAFLWVFMAAMTMLYVLEADFLAARGDHAQAMLGRGALWQMRRTAAHFLAFSPAYLLPWELPLMVMGAMVVLPGRRRRETVEPTARGV